MTNKEIKENLYILTYADKARANNRVKAVVFTSECTGYKGDIFHQPTKCSKIIMGGKRLAAFP